MPNVGNTPLIEVDGIYAKLECVNPCGSVKDRIAKYILEKSEERGLLRPGMTVVEATSGNTGVAFSYYARQKGYDVVIVMPEHMTQERKEIIERLGAKLIQCSKEGSFSEAVQIRDEMAKKPNYFCPDQFSNPLNAECHRTTTGQEIIKQIGKFSKSIDAFVAGVGTGGTLIGVGEALKEVNPDVAIFAVEPAESAVMTGGEAGIHCIPGIGDGFIPPIVQGKDERLHELISGVQVVVSKKAKEYAEYLEEKFGLCVGLSAGANFSAAREVAKSYSTVVTIFADGFERYKSENLKHGEKGRCKYEHLRDDVLKGLK